jgi:hypothetical protein
MSIFVTAYHGKHREFTVTITDSSGGAVNVSASDTTYLKIGRKGEASLISKTSDDTGLSASNPVLVEFTPAEMASLDPGTYDIEIGFTDASDNNYVKHADTGVFVLHATEPGLVKRIAQEAHIVSLLEIAGSVTEQDRAVIQQIHRYAEGRVKQHIGYDPVQKTITGHYPKTSVSAIPGTSAVWDVNASHSHARRTIVGAAVRDTIQLDAVPVRSISAVYSDDNAKWGDESGAWSGGTLWTTGDDYWAEWDAPGLCKSGIVHASGLFPVEPGTVKITYSAGYTREELEGEGGQVDASPILGAVVKTCVKAFNQFQAWKRRSGFGPKYGGPLQSEKAQDYSYTLGAGVMSQLSMMASLPGEAIDDLEPFRFYGRLRT